MDFVIESKGPFRVVGERSKRVFAQGQPGELWVVQGSRNGMQVHSSSGEIISGAVSGIILEPLNNQSTFLMQDARNTRGMPITLRTREFRGSLILYPQRRGNKFYVVNELPMEEYLLGVLPSEMPSYWPAEALKAQAVIARNYATVKKEVMRSHLKLHYNLCDSQHCQVYKGVGVENPVTNQAVKETFGKLLYHGSRLVYSYYHSTCGGYMQSSADVGWGNIPYLKGSADSEANPFTPTSSPWALSLWLKAVPPSNCNDPSLIPNSEFRWLRIVSVRTIERKLRRFRLGQIKEIIPLVRSKSGHINSVLVRGTRRSVVLDKEHEIRFYLGQESIRSSLFIVETFRDAHGKAKEFWLHGGGWGHGIGLCQAGAAGLAKNAGKSFEQILMFYYPGSEIGG